MLGFVIVYFLRQMNLVFDLFLLQPPTFSQLPSPLGPRGFLRNRRGSRALAESRRCGLIQALPPLLLEESELNETVDANAMKAHMIQEDIDREIFALRKQLQEQLDAKAEER